jgi:hypothetical protein
LVYEPARLEDEVFIGPAVVLTNDVYPRSTDVAGKLKRPADRTAAGVVVRHGVGRRPGGHRGRGGGRELYGHRESQGFTMRGAALGYWPVSLCDPTWRFCQVFTYLQA